MLANYDLPIRVEGVVNSVGTAVSVVGELGEVRMLDNVVSEFSGGVNVVAEVPFDRLVENIFGVDDMSVLTL